MSAFLAVVAAGLSGVGVFAVVQVLFARTATAETATLASRGSGGWYVLAALGAMCAGFVVGTVLGGTIAGGFPVAMLFAGVPRSVRARRDRDQDRRRHQAWPDALNSMSVGVASGRSLHAVMSELAVEGPAPLQPFWRRYRRLATTLDSADALDVIRDEADDAFVDRVVEVLRTALASGPHVAVTVLRDLADAASEDLQFEARVASAGLEQKINSRVVAVVPCLALFMVLWSSAAGREFYASPAGIVVSFVGSVLLGLGVVLVDVLGKLPSEPRVFIGSVVAP